MPLQQRVIEPVNVSRSTLPLPPGDIKPLIKKIAESTGQGLAANAAAAANVNIVNELECVTNGTLANLIRQLSSLSRQAEELLTGVFDDASKLLTRTVNLQQRMEALAMKAETLDQIGDAPLTLRDATKQEDFFSSDMSYDQQVLSKQKMPSSIAELYQTCEKPPPLNTLNPYRDDGKDGLKFYTDPTYFFELWKKEIHQQVNQLQRQQLQLKQQQRPQAQQQSQRPPTQQTLPQSAATQPQMQQQLHKKPQVHPQQIQHGQQQQQLKQQYLIQQQQPQQQQFHQQQQQAQQLLHHQQQQASQPQQQPVYQQSTNSIDPSIQQFQQSLYISNAPQTVTQPHMVATPPPPPPALSPLPAPSFPPPPPPPPAPPAPSGPAQPAAPSMPVLHLPTAAQLQQKQQQLRKTVPVQRDPRSDLLAAIKQGITLRRVEDSKRRVEAEKQQSMGNDVASILARRVAMQVSDSDDNDDDDEDNEWDDSNNG